MFEAVPLFRGFDNRYGYQTWKSELEYFFSYFSLTTDLSWMEKLIIGGEIIINYIDIGLSCKAFFVLGMLHPFTHLSPIAVSRILSKNSGLRSNPITEPFTVKVEIGPELSVIVNLMFLMRQSQKLLLS